MKARTVIEYIAQRLADDDITECFGVPGDYAFPVCDAVERNPNIKWIGCSNELPFVAIANSSAIGLSGNRHAIVTTEL
jgi:TPP-dependent 2-oxoacid decarboxylase